MRTVGGHAARCLEVGLGQPGKKLSVVRAILSCRRRAETRRKRSEASWAKLAEGSTGKERGRGGRKPALAVGVPAHPLSCAVVEGIPQLKLSLFHKPIARQHLPLRLSMLRAEAYLSHPLSKS